MLTITDLSFSYMPERPILEKFSLTASRGERICIRGASGKGKTTLLRLIAGLETPQKGTIILEPGCKTAMVFQEDRLLPWLTAKGNVSLVSDDAAAVQLLSALGLSDVIDAKPQTLSGGMCRRVALARALAVQPDLLLLDEAFKGIDPPRKAEIFRLLQTQFANACILFTTHDDAETDAFATRVVTL